MNEKDLGKPEAREILARARRRGDKVFVQTDISEAKQDMVKERQDIGNLHHIRGLKEITPKEGINVDEGITTSKQKLRNYKAQVARLEATIKELRGNS